MKLLTAEQVRGARAMLGWLQKDLADRSGVSLPSVKRLELGSGELDCRQSTSEKLRSAFEEAGVQFIDENGGGAGVRWER